MVRAIAFNRASGVTSIIPEILQAPKLYRLYSIPTLALICHWDRCDIAAQERMTHAWPIWVVPSFANARPVGSWYCWAIIRFWNVYQCQIRLWRASMNTPGPHLSRSERNFDFIIAGSYTAKAMKCSQGIAAGQKEACTQSCATLGDFDPVISACRFPFRFSHVQS